MSRCAQKRLVRGLGPGWVFEQVREVAAAAHFQPLRQPFHRDSCLFSQAAGQRDFERVAFVPVGQVRLTDCFGFQRHGDQLLGLGLRRLPVRS